MFQKCIVLTFLLFLAAGVYLLSECRSYLPYWRVLWQEYGTAFLWFAGLLFADITCLFYLLGRWLFLHETGRKLAHYDKQLLTGDSVTDELTHLVQEGRK